MDQKKIITALLTFVIVLFAESLEETKVKLQDNIDELKSKIKEEAKYFARFKMDKSKIIRQKKEEVKTITADNADLKQRIAAIKNQIKEYEYRINAVKKENTQINTMIKKICQTLKQKITHSIPYAKQKRRGVLDAIIMDIESQKSQAVESFTRLMAFLQNEEMLAYDSQVFEKVVKINGKNKNSTVIRIGRVFFACDTGKEVYLYKKENNRYILDPRPISVLTKRDIRLAIKIIQGKKPPDLVKLPFPSDNVIEKN